MYQRLEDLRIFTESEKLADEIWREVMKWSHFEKNSIGLQLVRSTDSIGANIAEGFGRHHLKESLQFFYFSRGSLEETRYWLRRAKSRGLSPDGKFFDRLEILSKQLNSFISKNREKING